jgi:hypothetical protein
MNFHREGLIPFQALAINLRLEWLAESAPALLGEEYRADKLTSNFRLHIM